MTTFYIDFFYAGRYRTADLFKDSNSYQLKYTIHFTHELAVDIELEWVEITYEHPVTYFNSLIIAPLAQMNYSNLLFEEIEVIDTVMQEISVQEYGA